MSGSSNPKSSRNTVTHYVIVFLIYRCCYRDGTVPLYFGLNGVNRSSELLSITADNIDLREHISQIHSGSGLGLYLSPTLWHGIIFEGYYLIYYALCCSGELLHLRCISGPHSVRLAVRAQTAAFLLVDIGCM